MWVEFIVAVELKYRHLKKPGTFVVEKFILTLGPEIKTHCYMYINIPYMYMSDFSKVTLYILSGHLTSRTHVHVNTSTYPNVL